MLVAELLKGVELDPGQVAELRAMTAHYYTQVARSESAPNASSSALDELILARVREMLNGEQRLLFDRVTSR
jgi:hypothetical protein